MNAAIGGIGILLNSRAYALKVELFYTDLNASTRNITKLNVLIIGGNFNAHLGYDDGHKYSLHRETNRNGNMLQSYLQENNLLYLNTNFQKRLGQKWTHTSMNGFKSQIDFLIINKKWKNSAKKVLLLVDNNSYQI